MNLYETMRDNFFACDIETDGHIHQLSKIWCVSVKADSVKTHYSPSVSVEYNNFLSEFKGRCASMHNGICFDLPVLANLSNYKPDHYIDTLPLACYLYSNHKLQGLEAWGERLGIPKPPVTDWKNITEEEVTNRCESDVKIQYKLHKYLFRRLDKLYEDDYGYKVRTRLLKYLNFKFRCMRDHANSPLALDEPLARRNLSDLQELKSEAFNRLSEVMPDVPVFSKYSRPKKPYKKSGELSATGKAWLERCELAGVDPDSDITEVKIQSGYDKANPNSSDQVKSWLFSLGWQPQTFDYKKNPDGSERRIPQVNRKSGKGICPSVQKLYSKHPEVKDLEGYGVISHRIGVLKGFLESQQSGMLSASAVGLTSTLRFRHSKPLTNLPKITTTHGDKIRPCLKAPKGWKMYGSDMIAIEDKTAQHYMMPYDPDYVKEMQDKDFDSHLDMAVHAGLITKDQYWQHIRGEQDFSAERTQGKTVNHSAKYGVGAKTMSRNSGMGLMQCQNLIESYWKRNWSIKAFEHDCIVRSVNKDKYVLNPVSGFYMPLRADKDRFSAVNQSTAVYAFDLWVMQIKKLIAGRDDIAISAQFHDEVIVIAKDEVSESEVVGILKQAICKVNQQLKLRVDLDVSVDIGYNYGEVH